jgi:hypothetical protein
MAKAQMDGRPNHRFCIPVLPNHVTHRHPEFTRTQTQLKTQLTMFPLALLSTTRQRIVLLPRLFSSSATLGYPKLKTHSGSKKRWRALASGVFKRVSSAQVVPSAK